MIAKAGDKRKTRRELLRQHGLCVNCKSPSPDRHFCQACRNRYNATQRAKTAKYREDGLCIDCGRPAAGGRVRCGRCLESRTVGGVNKPRTTKRLCECCQVDAAIVNAPYCRGCVRLMAEDALRLKLHSRCEEGGSLDLEPETLELPEYKAAKRSWSDPQKLLPCIEQPKGFSKTEPFSVPEYSRKVFADSIRWEG